MQPGQTADDHRRSPWRTALRTAIQYNYAGSRKHKICRTDSGKRVTHSFDMEQRLVGLNFAAVGGALQATAPANGNLASWILLALHFE